MAWREDLPLVPQWLENPTMSSFTFRWLRRHSFVVAVELTLWLTICEKPTTTSTTAETAATTIIRSTITPYVDREPSRSIGRITREKESLNSRKVGSSSNASKISLSQEDDALSTAVVRHNTVAFSSLSGTDRSMACSSETL